MVRPELMRDGVVGADRQHVAHPALADAAAQLTAAVDFIAGHEGGADPQACARSSRTPASCGLVANSTSSGTPASSRCSSSAAHPSGRYKARPISACPRPVAKVKVTATWHSATPPAVPLYWRAAPAQSAEDFSSAVSSTISTASSSSR